MVCVLDENDATTEGPSYPIAGCHLFFATHIQRNGQNKYVASNLVPNSGAHRGLCRGGMRVRASTFAVAVSVGAFMFALNMDSNDCSVTIKTNDRTHCALTCSGWSVRANSHLSVSNWKFCNFIFAIRSFIRSFQHFFLR